MRSDGEGHPRAATRRPLRLRPSRRHSVGHQRRMAPREGAFVAQVNTHLQICFGRSFIARVLFTYNERSGTDKATILRAVQRARSVLTLRSALRVIGLSASRYTAWRQADECELDDTVASPQKHPTRLTPEEVRLMRDMATAPEYRHVATSTLAMLAQRLGTVFAAPATWCRYVRDRGWRRPRKRVHPSAPKVGVRATKPNGSTCSPCRS